MNLELGEVIAKFDGGTADVVYDSNGPFGDIQSTTPTPVANFTMPYEGHVVATMWFTPGTNTTTSNVRGLAVDVGGSRVESHLTNASKTYILSCYGDLPAGVAQILVNSGSNYSSSSTTPTRIRVITWRD